MGRIDKVAFLCHPYHRGGVTRWMADAAIACSKQGMQVWFITVAPVKEFHSAKGKETLLQLLNKEKHTVQIVSQPVGYEFEFGTPEYRAWIYKHLLVKVPTGTPVILSDDHSVWEAACSLYKTYSVVGVMHADENHYYDLAAKYYSQVALFACVSGRVKETTTSRIPDFSPSLIFTIPCGINLPPATADLPAKHKLQLVFVGRVSEYQKRAGDLIKIAEKLTAQNIDFHLTIIGDGNLKPLLEKQAVEKGLSPKVSFTGWLSQRDVAKRLSESDILLLTSDFEGTPIAMMEAFAAGCGMVGTRVSGMEDYEHHPLAGDCLGIYAVGQIEEAISKIVTVAGIPPSVRRQAARRIAETEFSMSVCLDRYLMAISFINATPTPAPPITFSSKHILYSRLLATARNLKIKATGK